MIRLFEKLKLRWHLRGSTPAPLTTTAIPTAQHEMLSEDEKWKREHGFSAATSPMADTAETEAHNRAIDEEYQEEIERRKALMEAGEYMPRFATLRPGHEIPEDLVGNGPAIVAWMLANPGAVDVNWHLELTLEPGRRADVTKDIGKPVLQMPTAEDLAQVDELNRQRRKLEALEAARALAPFRSDEPTRDDVLHGLGLNPDDILAACGGDEALAAQVQQKAVALVDDILEANRESQPQD